MFGPNLAIGIGAGGIRAFSPEQISGLTLWLKADAITGLADGAALTTWEDSSGEDNDAAQATADNKPTYKTNILNGLPVVRFDGTADFLQTPDLGLSQPGTVLIVASRTAAAERHMLDGTSTRWLMGGTATNWIMFAGSVLDTGDAQDTDAHVHTCIFNGASSKYRLDGTEIGSGDAGAQGLAMTLIGCGNSQTAFHPGDIAEVLIYDSALSAGNLALVEAYLSAKYAL